MGKASHRNTGIKKEYFLSGCKRNIIIKYYKTTLIKGLVILFVEANFSLFIMF